MTENRIDQVLPLHGADEILHGAPAHGLIVHHEGVGACVNGSAGAVEQVFAGDVDRVQAGLVLPVGPQQVHDRPDALLHGRILRIGLQLVILDDVGSAHSGLQCACGADIRRDADAGLQDRAHQRTIINVQQLANAVDAHHGAG